MGAGLRLAAQARRCGQIHLVTWPGVKAARRLRLGDPRRPRSCPGDQPRRYHDLRGAYITDIDRVADTATTPVLARRATPACRRRSTSSSTPQDLAGAANRPAKRRARLKIVK
ncbi:hypothetical protein [Reyranella sp.]|uniref:hypothetical protein n=1 Tax=Reyranella sp. TaxID=1929291 RepID=UPI00403509BD